MSTPSPAVIATAIVVAIGAAFLVPKFWPKEEPLPVISPPAAASDASEQQAADEPEAEPFELPALDASDGVVRSLVDALSGHPQLISWLAPDDLIRGFVAAVDNIAQGQSPRPNLGQLRPKDPFAAVERRDRLYIDERSFHRYDLAVEVLESIDVGAAARLFRNLEPLCNEAYVEQGYPDGEFENALSAAIERLLAVPLVAGDIELRRRVTTYEFADPELEALGPVEKHLLRMGPENAQRVQAQLRTVKTVLNL